MKATYLLLLVVLMSVTHFVSAEPVVVVSAASSTTQLSKTDVTNIFMGRYRKLPDGTSAVPIDQADNSSVRADFYLRLINKDLNEINAYWSRLVFSGKTAPPVQATSAAEVIYLLTTTAGGVAYLERSLVDKRLRIVMEFPK